jgi:hypothetical protein
MCSDKGRAGDFAGRSSPMLDGNAYKALMSDDAEPDLVPRLRDPALLNAFAALANDLRTILKALGRCGPNQ